MIPVVTTLRAIALDIAGLAFCGVTVWGLITGHGVGDAAAIAAFYLGVKVPAPQ